MIGSGMSATSYLIYGLTLPMMQQMLHSGTLPMPSEYMVALEEILGYPRPYFLCCALLYALSLTGVIMMWNLRKNGFHLYTLAQLLVLLVTVLFLGKESMPIGNVMFTLLFVTYYFMAFKRIEKFQPEQTENPTDSESAE